MHGNIDMEANRKPSYPVYWAFDLCLGTLSLDSPGPTPLGETLSKPKSIRLDSVAITTSLSESSSHSYNRPSYPDTYMCSLITAYNIYIYIYIFIYYNICTLFN